MRFSDNLIISTASFYLQGPSQPVLIHYNSSTGYARALRESVLPVVTFSSRFLS